MRSRPRSLAASESGEERRRRRFPCYRSRVRWSWELAISIAVAAAAGCTSDDGFETDDGDDGAIHACFGAVLTVGYDGDVDGIELAATIEAMVPALECSDRALPRIVECLPVAASSDCGFESAADAMACEPEFRDALVAFSTDFDPYAFSVIDECYCRAY